MACRDWHLHTHISDGEESPLTILEKARDLGLESISITDHDAISAYRSLPDEGGIELVTGIELDCTFEGRNIEILGYHIAIENTELNDYLGRIQKERKLRAQSYIKEINDFYKYEVLLEKEVMRKECHTILKPHIIHPLIEKGIFKSYGEAKKFVDSLSVPRFSKATAEEAIGLIRRSGGISVFAHPGVYPFSPSEVTRMIGILRDWGMDGVETYYPYHYHQPERYTDEAAELDWIHRIEAQAAELGLSTTRGSDSHTMEDLIRLNQGKSQLNNSQ